MNLPFGLTTKPTRHYFKEGSISFAVSNGTLYYIVTNTTKQTKSRLYSNPVTNKEMLDRLLKVESFDELQTIEVVA